MVAQDTPPVDASEDSLVTAARDGDEQAFRSLTEQYSRELHLHCYRMLGSLHDAEDLVQETFLRAWRHLDSFAGRASFRAWLYKIATNACLDELDRRPRRLLPTAYGQAAGPGELPAPPAAEILWLEPYPDTLGSASDAAASDPELRYAAREHIALAFLAAIQYLPPRQRAVLILRDVLDWAASEVAELLESSVASVNSALQRARATLRRQLPQRQVDSAVQSASDELKRTLLDRYLHAWNRADMDALVALLKEDATLSMPPVPSWYRGRASIAAFFSAVVFGAGKQRRLVPTRANGQPAFAMYDRDPQSGFYRAFGLKVLTLQHGMIAEITGFLDPGLFRLFGLPDTLEP